MQDSVDGVFGAGHPASDPWIGACGSIQGSSLAGTVLEKILAEGKVGE